MKFSLFATASFIAAAFAAPAPSTSDDNATAPCNPVPGVPCPVKSLVGGVTDALTLVHSLKVEIEVELAAICNTRDVGAIEAKIGVIVSKVETCTSKVDALLAEAAANPGSFPPEKLDDLCKLVEEVKGLVVKVESTVATVAATLTADVLVLLKPALIRLKSCVSLFAKPILALVFGLAASVNVKVLVIVGKLLSVSIEMKICLVGMLGPVAKILGELL